VGRRQPTPDCRFRAASDRERLKDQPEESYFGENLSLSQGKGWSFLHAIVAEPLLEIIIFCRGSHPGQ